MTPLRKLLEIGSAADDGWVRARQYTGRIVFISNKAVFTEPVYNSSTAFDYLWEEMTLPVQYEQNWKQAEQILREEAEHASVSAGAREAMTKMRERYPVGRADGEPRVFVRATDKLGGTVGPVRGPIPRRPSGQGRDELAGAARFVEAGLSVASATQDITVHRAKE